MHEAAARGFERGAGDYQRARPSYPVEAVDLLAAELPLVPGARVLDLAAGTGIFTRLLVDRGVDVVAVEPVEGMRQRLAADLPGVELLEGTAEALPLPEASVDAVTVAQAFHWFEAEAALAEIRRVLRPGGGLAIVWNIRDRSTGWVRDMAELLEERVGPLPYEQHHQRADALDEWRSLVAAAGGFTALQSASFPYVQEADIDLLVGRAASTSFVSALPDHEREQVLAELRAMLEAHPDLAAAGPRFPFPHVTRVYWCHREG